LIFAVFIGNSLKANCALIDSPTQKIVALVPWGKGSHSLVTGTVGRGKGLGS
jgi:hypothetical protein